MKIPNNGWPKFKNMAEVDILTFMKLSHDSRAHTGMYILFLPKV
jgi:hypothetical protein